MPLRNPFAITRVHHTLREWLMPAAADAFQLTIGVLNVLASGSEREKDSKEKSEYGSDQCFQDRVLIKRPRSSAGNQKAAIRHS
jgi:hypothetical protein